MIRMNHRWNRMDRTTEIRPPHTSYSLTIRICYLRSLRCHLQLCRPPIQTNNFELNGVILQMPNNIQFHGLHRENLNAHLTSFIEVCNTVKYNGVIEEAPRLQLFQLSISDRAKHWLTSQPPDFTPHGMTWCRNL